MGYKLVTGYQPAIAHYKIKKEGSWYIIYDISTTSITSVIGATSTFWGAKRKMKKYIKNKKKKQTNYYFTENGVEINE